jgi:hypothetical protein
MNKPFYGAASIPQSERRILYTYTAAIVNKENVPGPGTYDASK